MNGNEVSNIDRRSTISAAQKTNVSAREQRRSSLHNRPSSAPKAESSQDESEVDQLKLRAKSLLHRSKSDCGPRGEDKELLEEEIQDWGARHGFEDHYASEEYVSQLANVSGTFLS